MNDPACETPEAKREEGGPGPVQEGDGKTKYKSNGNTHQSSVPA